MSVGSATITLDGTADAPIISGTVDGHRRRTAFYEIPLPAPGLVTIELQEDSSASHCAIYMSCTTPHPDERSASWRVVSPEIVKRVQLHPCDARYRLGSVYIAIEYIEESGAASYQLRTFVQPTFKAVWLHAAGGGGRLAAESGAGPSPYAAWGKDAALSSSSAPVTASAASTVVAAPTMSQQKDERKSNLINSVYIGEWEGASRAGAGSAFYLFSSGVPADDAGGDLAGTSFSLAGDVEPMKRLLRAMTEQYTQPWSAWSIPQLIPEEDVTNSFYSCRVTSGTSPLNCVAEISTMGTVVQTNLAAADLAEWQVLPPAGSRLEVYAGEWQHNTKHGLGVYQWADRSYVGPWVRGVREGQGLLRRCDGSWYRGEWLADRPDGEGEAFYVPSGRRYKGEWVRGVRQGHGTLTLPSGITVCGPWADDEIAGPVTVGYQDHSSYKGGWVGICREGEGVLTAADGRIFTNTWEEDVRQGPGKIVFPNGVWFEGVWKDDVAVSGVYHMKDGARYEGDFATERDFCRAGEGRCIYANGNIYEGSWKEDAPSGRGMMQYKAGDGSAASPSPSSPFVATYEGEWERGRRHGTGILRDVEGCYEGGFARDVRCGYGEQQYSNGSSYKGQWHGDERTGSGVYYDAVNDMTYEGLFLHSRMTGQGSAAHAKDGTYSGAWLDGFKQGGGTLMLPNGDTITGLWHRGVPNDGAAVTVVEVAAGNKYHGGWRGEMREGHGVQLYRDGSVYEGEWLNNVPNGHGTRTTADGVSVTCRWENGCIAAGGEATVVHADGSRYEGEVDANGVPHGEGVLHYLDGTQFRGTFHEGVYQL